MSFSYLDVILFIAISQGIFLAFSLQFISQKNKRANTILTLFLLLATFILCGKIASYYYTFEAIWRISLFSDTSIFLFGPLLYYYFKYLVFQKDSKVLIPFKHFIPACLQLLFFAWSLTKSTKEYIALMYTKPIQIAYFMMEFVALVSLLYYSVLCYKIIGKLKVLEKKELSYERNLHNYLLYILIGLSAFLVFWTIGIFKTYILYSHNSHINYQIMWITTPFFFYIIGYFSLTRPEVLQFPYKKAASKNRLSNVEVIAIKKRLEELVETHQIYLEHDLSLKTLASKAETSSNNLSWLLNTVYKKSFYEYINQFRIEAFLGKIKEGQHKTQTILSIANDVGFNSKSTFNKSFKLLLQETPSNYIKKHFPKA